MAISSNAARAYAYLRSRGYSDYAAAGMVGGLIGESGRGLNVKAYNPNDPGGSAGIAQWNRERRAAMQAWKDPSAKDELERQLSYLVHELKTRESRAGKMLSGAGSLDAAARGAISFERPAGWTSANPAGGHNYAGRLAAARQVYLDQTGKSPTIGGAPTAVASASGGGGVPASVPPAPELPAAPAAPPPPSPTDNIASGLDMLMGGTGQLTPGNEEPSAPAAAPPSPPSLLAGAPSPPPEPPPRPTMDPSQGSAATLMASLLDQKRTERGVRALPPGLLESIA